MWTISIMLVILLTYTASSNSSENDPYRPQYHVIPPKNWMNDPNGPIYYKGYYHLFFQYNPVAPIGGQKIHWGHVVSKDLAFWELLPIALYPDQSYDSEGCWSGSTVLLDDGTPALLYTCVSDTQRQCVAYPKNASDPLLVDWVKPAYNPIIRSPPPGGDSNDFRDPATPWKEGNTWNLVTGCEVNGIGSGLLWQSTDFKTWEYQHTLYSNKDFSVWECPDFFPVPNREPWYIFKYSCCSADGQDWWLVGERNSTNHFNPLPGVTAIPCSEGKYYASKNFFDPLKNRQINWGWVPEEDTAGPSRGWQGIQSFPSVVTVDPDFLTPRSEPIEEISLLRGKHYTFSGQVGPSQPFQPNVQSNQIELLVKFKLTPLATSFGVNVLMSHDAKIFTSITFKRVENGLGSLFLDRNQSGTTGAKNSQGGTFKLKGSEEDLTIHILIDHSLVEVFAADGRMRITSRLYTPDNAMYMQVFSEKQDLSFNVDMWEMKSIWTK